jgi:hypothetical protein
MTNKKRVSISAYIPQLSSVHAYQTSSGEGSTLNVAIGRAVDALLKADHVKGHRVSSMKLTISVIDHK